MDETLKRNLLIIWVSMLSTQVLFVAVATQTVPSSVERDPTWMAVAGAAVLPVVVSLAWGRVVARDTAVNARWVVRWAAAEAVGVLGIVLAFLGAPDVAVGALLGLGFLLTLVQFPREER